MNGPEQKNVSKGIALALVAAVLWGVSGTFGQFIFQQRDINVEWMITVRLLLSGSLLLLTSVIKNGSAVFNMFRNRKDMLQLFTFSIIGMLAVQYTYFAAIKHSNAATATILQYIGPVIIVIYLAVKERRMPLAKEIIAILLAVLGTFLLVTHGDISTLHISPLAFFLGIASAIALAIYTLQPVELLKKHDAASIVGWGMLIAGIVFSFVHPPWKISGQWDDATYISIAFIILLGTVIPFHSYLTAVNIIGGAKTSLLASAEPLSATLIAVWWLQVPFGNIDYIGSACIISTIFILSYDRKRKR